eukprot:ctg_2207.g434
MRTRLRALHVFRVADKRGLDWREWSGSGVRRHSPAQAVVWETRNGAARDRLATGVFRGSRRGAPHDVQKQHSDRV